MEAVRPSPILSALFGMKAEDSELLGTAELIRGTDGLQTALVREPLARPPPQRHAPVGRTERLQSQGFKPMTPENTAY